MQHRWNTINQDISTHGSSSAEKQLNCSKNCVSDWVMHIYWWWLEWSAWLLRTWQGTHPPAPCGRASSEEDLVKRCSSTALVTSFPPVTTWKHSYMIGRGASEGSDGWEGKGSGAWWKGEVCSKGHIYGGKHWRVGVYTITNWSWNGVEWMSAGKQCIPIIYVITLASW